jgi:hypothetical protein
MRCQKEGDWGKWEPNDGERTDHYGGAVTLAYISARISPDAAQPGAPVVNAPIQTCYISAPAGANLSILREVLSQRRIRVVVPEDLPIGSSWPAQVDSILARVDLVIGVLTRERRSASVLFELGQAWARERKILLIVPPKSSLVPSDLHGILQVRSGLRNPEAIGFALDQLAAAPPSKQKAPDPTRRVPRALGSKADEYLGEVWAALHAREGRRLEHIAAEAIRESGVEVVSEQQAMDKGVDLAIWSDALQPLIGNPVLVEIKSYIQSPDEARRGLSQLSSALSASGTMWGLLLYGETPITEERLSSLAPPNVLVLSLETLFSRMREQPFADVVRDLRNRRVHGGQP